MKNWNPATCSCENGKYLASIIDDSVIMCDEIIESYGEETKIAPTNFIKKCNLWNEKILHFIYLFIN